MKKTKTVTTLILIAAMLLTACSGGGNDGRSSRSDRKEKDVKEKETEEKFEKEETEVLESSETTIEEQPVWIQNGDYIVFGHYEQDDNTDNGPEPLEWEVVREEDGKILLISRYVIDCQPYNTTNIEVTWETCSLREWLNDVFLNEAFNAYEQSLIIETPLSNPENEFDGSKGGNDTMDKVFCLSVEEILDNYEFQDWNEELFGGSSKALFTEVTKYAEDQGVEKADNGPGKWWLRSSLRENVYACGVIWKGAGWSVGYSVDDDEIGVRPALYLSVK